jgi:adenosylcobinamide-phosphate synthase
VIAGLAIGLAATLELTVAEPPQRVHPVAWFGRAVAPVDREWRAPTLVGLLAVLVLPFSAAGVVAALVLAAGLATPWFATAAAGLALFVSTSLRMLLDEAWSVVATTVTDLDAARTSLRALAGRDASDLSAGQVRSAAVESAAENLADGLVAPLGAFLVGVVAGTALALAPTAALALGAGGAAWVKAVNTLDSMLGYRSKPVGWAPARVDDLVMWVPARASAVALALAARDPGALLRARPWLAGVPSPNSGWPMGTLSAAHDARLEKPGVYTLAPDARLPGVERAREAIGTVAVAGVLAYLAALVVVIAWS